jgi:16S rRNA (guanine527-N7)-methyltransferase
MDGGAAEKLEVYKGLLRGEAATWGLIGFGDGDEKVVQEQIERSLVLLDVLGRPERLVDVGSGAGLPGIPLMIVLGNGVLVEPKRKAAAFLESVIRRLGLAGSVFVGSAEEGARGALRDWGDAVVARAVGSPVVAAELCAPLCAPGGTVLLTAAPGASPADLPEEACRALALGPAGVRSLEVSGATGAGIEQRVLMMSKVAPTPSAFPRRPGTARRRPLGLDSRS